MLLPQIILVIIVMAATGIGITFIGEALGFEFIKPDIAAAENRFGDLANNTSQYLIWIAIIWFAGPAEELFFEAS